MTHDKRYFRLVRHALKIRPLEVRRASLITPRMKRITLGGPELEGFVTLAPEDHVKLFFPAPGREDPVLPIVGPLGLALPIGAKGKPISRDYTPRRYDPSVGELDIDFFLHGDGVAARWAAQAGAGQRIGVGGPRGSYVLSGDFDWHLLVGDETSLPEMSRRIEELPAGVRAYALIAVTDGGEEQPFETPAEVVVRWVHRAAHEPTEEGPLASELRRFQLPPGNGFTWIAGEASEVRSAYRHLVNERGVDRALVHASGHWKRGISNHDHHEPITI